MLSPETLIVKLSKQWHQADIREARLLSSSGWPIELNIGKPTAQMAVKNTAKVRHHIERWRSIQVGEVISTEVKYRDFSEPVVVPVFWRLRQPSEWISAINDPEITAEFQKLSHIISAADPEYHRILIRQRALWLNKTAKEVTAVLQLVDKLSPGMASGRPLRLLSGLGVDTKFFERHFTLIEKLLDVRYTGAVAEVGLQAFLGAPPEKDHWLLVKPLSSGILPFKRIRLTSKELETLDLPAHRILLVENEQCEHLLPDIHDCIAILGAGLDLGWLAGDAWQSKKLLYWGDIDTWGLLMLSRAREAQPGLRSILMNPAVYDSNKDHAVSEPVKAQDSSPPNLTTEEKVLYERLVNSDKGRLEQEFISEDLIKDALSGL
ncbi:DUF3322 domain-containing protein [Thalassolituus alkanivorans]|uniref:DUF3322 domain-containing protein n=1 Tax=Thalassolituus alkanivorans TaxID=2881055 RepID=UPI001E559C02|nr:DUF3322 domain-containing protein [Thalassolituus alkanivorans]MCB2385031.1 DUF2220 family protein [Thalassolituus alkanivorans]MCB2424503.1 DUF2220 family protein [Thalassolituus alkanivorans]